VAAGDLTDRIASTRCPPAPGKVQIPYGRDETGRMRHVSEVPAGLSSRCVCPACGTPLVAYKGKLKRHHFGHHADHACSGAFETALHEFAKQVLADSRMLWLPPLIARHGQAEKRIRPAGEFSYDAVDVEKAMPNMRPDVIVRSGDAVLMVEIAVRHPCEETKLALIRERRLPAIEIDLSRIRYDGSPREHADAVLRLAPRHWLFNRHVDQAEGELRQQAIIRASEEDARRDRAWGKLAAVLAAAYQVKASRGHPSWLAAVSDAELEQAVGVAIAGDGCFAVPATVWQSALLYQFVLGQGLYADLTPSIAVEWLAEKAFLKPAFRALPTHMAEAMKDYLIVVVPGFRPPVDVVTEFMTGLARQGVLQQGRTRWSAATVQAAEARREWQLANAGRRRVAELKEAVEPVKKAARRGATIDIDTWVTTPHDGLKATPAEIATAGGFPFEDLKRRLQALLDTLKPNAYPASGSLLGLPLAEDQEARRIERDDRRETERRDRERREQIASERRQSETRVFLSEMRTAANEVLGDQGGDEWMSKSLPSGLTASDALELRSEEMSSMRRALEIERYRLEGVVQAQAAASAMAMRCLHELRERAARDPTLLAAGRLDLWMGTSQPKLGGSRPKDVCVDRLTLGQCVALLPSRSATSGRGRRR
jgi:hypothetical protein